MKARNTMIVLLNDRPLNIALNERLNAVPIGFATYVTNLSIQDATNIIYTDYGYSLCDSVVTSLPYPNRECIER